MGNDLVYRAFKEQSEFHKSQKKERALLAGKRGGKTEAGAIEALIHVENKIGKRDYSIDPHLGLIIAPTNDMLNRVTLKKFNAYSKPFKYGYHQTEKHYNWHNGAEIYAISADKPERMEGVKPDWIWIDEAMQCKEQVYLEAKARVLDTDGRLWITSSLGVQYTNPKASWIYKYFKENPSDDSAIWEWATAQNPYVAKHLLEQMKNDLDPRTYRMMFEVDWNVPGSCMVYEDFDEGNLIKGYQYNKDLETSICIDWGWAHQMAVGVFQYDSRIDRVVLFDEYVKSRMTLDDLWDWAKSRGYNYRYWISDVAGDQEREQTGISNCDWFKTKHNINITRRRSKILHGIALVRTYVKNGLGQRKFQIDEQRCPKSVDGLRNYRYPEKNGIIQNELPVKKDDDCADMIRYFFVNRLDKEFFGTKELNTLDRWKKWGS